MDLRIFVDLLECAYDVQTLSFQQSEEEEKYAISEDNQRMDYIPPKVMIYCITNCGYFELHVTYLKHAFYGEPRIQYNYYLDCSLTGIPLETVREMVNMQLNNEGFLSGCKDKNITVNAY